MKISTVNTANENLPTGGRTLYIFQGLVIGVISFILPPQPSMEISKSTLIPQLGSAKVLDRAAIAKEDAKQMIMAENQAQSLHSPNPDSRIRNLGDVTTLTVGERNEIACKSLSSLKACRMH